jgi:4-diphosphocytidyl-2-C-methyl-D-erythritol kinase
MGRPDGERGASPCARVRVRIPAKVNLFLAVRGTRDDGYHELVSIMQTVGIHDTVTVQLEGSELACRHPAARRFMGLEFGHDAGGDVPDDERNLAVRAARTLMEATGTGTSDATDRERVPTTRVSLTKRIPVAAGMAGGSADAAATLVGLNRLWETDLDRDALRELAADLGADVPFAVLGGTALATGTGTATAQVLSRGTYHWVIGMSDRPLSTPDVYRTFDDIGRPSVMEPDAVLHALRTADPEALGAALHNDLEVAAFHLRPELAEARDALLDAGALGAIVSGSGPTIVALGEDERHARALARELGSHFDRCEVAPSPAGGPDVADLR